MTPPTPSPQGLHPLLERARQSLLTQHRPLASTDLAQISHVTNCILAQDDPAGIGELLSLAHEVRLAWCGDTVEVEGILSAKTGGCPEDCHFCSQSSRHQSPVKATPMLDPQAVLQAAQETAKLGASEFCIVLAVRGPDERIMAKLIELTNLVRRETGLNVAVSAGILTPEQARTLADAGVHRYNHNLETSRSYFPNICTTHTYDDRLQTCQLVKEAGMQLCCGVLLGMGETPDQRLELLEDLRLLEPEEVPVNFLNPRPGTPLASRSLMSSTEALAWVALFRLGLPGVILRYAGGRELTLGELQALGMRSGVNALIVGNYLTTLGRAPEEDLAMLEELSMPVGALTGVL